jgi:hypothetical protein
MNRVRLNNKSISEVHLIKKAVPSVDAKSKRRHKRLKPEKSINAQIDPTGTQTRFEPTITALVIEESIGGVGIVVVGDTKLQTQSRFWIRVGLMNPTKAEVRWRLDLDSQVARLGLMYI